METTTVALVVLLVGITSFGLGRLSARSQTPLAATGVTLVAPAPLSAVTEQVVSADGGADTTMQYVASRSGTKYHYVWCSSAGRISEENRVYFATVEEARAAGYTPAANCPGLQ